MRRLELTRKKFGKLTALRISHVNSDNKLCWVCVCDCGKEVTVIGKHLKSGNTSSCGCSRIGNGLTHGGCSNGKKEPEYHIWRSMKERCLNPNNKNYNRYGGRGIKVCDRWLNDYGAFISDMGKKPFPKATLDRKENDGDYSAQNCRWATQEEQVNNKNNNRKLSLFGKTQSMRDWAKETGIPYGTICMRLFRNWTVEKTLTHAI